MLVTITLLWQHNVRWYLHHFPVSCLGIPVSVSSCLHEFFWSPPLLSVSCRRIPVFCYHPISFVRISSSFLQRTLLFHIAQMLLLVETNGNISLLAASMTPDTIIHFISLSRIVSQPSLSRCVSKFSHH